MGGARRDTSRWHELLAAQVESGRLGSPNAYTCSLLRGQRNVARYGDLEKALGCTGVRGSRLLGDRGNKIPEAAASGQAA